MAVAMPPLHHDAHRPACLATATTDTSYFWTVQFRSSCAKRVAKTWQPAFGNQTESSLQLLSSYRQRTAGKDEARMMAEAAAALAKA
jgi:hypothetical protein